MEDNPATSGVLPQSESSLSKLYLQYTRIGTIYVMGVGTEGYPVSQTFWGILRMGKGVGVQEGILTMLNIWKIKKSVRYLSAVQTYKANRT